MNPILQALSSGYSPRKILDYLSRSSPDLGQKIAQAASYGYAAEKILKFVMEGGKHLSNILPNALADDSNIYNKMQYSFPKDIKNAAKFGVGLAATAFGASYLNSPLEQDQNQSISGELIQPSIPPQFPEPDPFTIDIQNKQITNQQPQISYEQGIIPFNPIQPGPQIGQQIQQNAQPQIGLNLQQPQNIAPAPNPVSPVPTSQTSQLKSSDVLQSFGLLNSVKNMLDKGQSVEEISNVLNTILKKDQRKQFGNLLKSGQTKPLIELVKDVQQEKGGPAIPLQYNPDQQIQEQNPLLTQQIQQPVENITEIPPEILNENAIQEPAPEPITQIPYEPQKNSFAETPNGFGEIKGISGDKAIVEIDGKAHKIDKKDLEKSLYSDDDVADAYDRLMEVIPEPHKSSWIQWAAYDENTNTLTFLPRGGVIEELKNITPQEAEMIKKGEGIARTSGEVREGLWVKGEDTRGGIISQIIWDRKKKQKENESKQMMLPFDIPKKEKQTKGMQRLFDEMEYAREKSRERDKKRKLQEKEMLKGKKDEEKKRKKQS
jgi:hypothetical protein